MGTSNRRTRLPAAVRGLDRATPSELIERQGDLRVVATYLDRHGHIEAARAVRGLVSDCESAAIRLDKRAEALAPVFRAIERYEANVATAEMVQHEIDRFLYARMSWHPDPETAPPDDNDGGR